MFSLYSKGCEYTLRALICGLGAADGGGFRVQDACRRAKVPEPFTRKGFQRLAHEGLLQTVRGPGGGYQLAASPGAVSILEIVRIVDGRETFEHCVMGLSRCSDTAPCPIHEIWKKMKKKLIEELGRTTLHQIIQSTKKKAELGLYPLKRRRMRKAEAGSSQ